jgi:hypothetical protein
MLKEHRPDLLAEVEAKRLSVHAAMVQAGFRPRTETLPMDNMRRLADRLVALICPKQIVELIAALRERIDK